MPLRPFPLPIRIGTDICQTARFAWALAPSSSTSSTDHVSSTTTTSSSTASSLRSRRLSRLVTRLLHPLEATHFWHRYHRAIPSLALPARRDWVARFLAGRWAAKEATIKALGHRPPHAFHQILLLAPPATLTSASDVTAPSVAPRLLVLDESSVARTREARSVAEMLSMGEGWEGLVSISHDGGYATAVAVVPEGVA